MPSSKPKKPEWIHSYYKQAAGYAVMWEERTGIPITQLVVLVMVDGDNPQIFIENSRKIHIKQRKIIKQINSSSICNLLNNVSFSYYKDKFFMRSGYRQIGKKDTEESLTFGLGGTIFLIGKEIEINYTYQEYGIWGYMQYFEFIFNL